MHDDWGEPPEPRGTPLSGLVAVSDGLQVRRNTNEVTVTITCPDSYAAMELYDLILQAAGRGLLVLNVMTKDGGP